MTNPLVTIKQKDGTERLVAALEADIRKRRLRHGDKYLTTQEVAAMLGVSTRAANDAMTTLATRNVLLRRPKAGTTIGSATPYESTALLDVVHLLIRQDYFFSERVRLEAMVAGLTRVLDGAAVQFSFVPAFNESAAVERIVREAEASGVRCGFLIAVKSPQVQEFFQRQQVPAVLLGTPYSGIRGICWQDKDQRQIGALVAQAMIDAGHARIAVVLRDRRGFGDDLMMDAITETVLEANLGSGALCVRSVPTEPALTEVAITQLLLSPERPTAIICRSRLILETAARTARALKLSMPRELLLGLCDPLEEGESPTSTSCVRPVVASNARDEGVLIGQMLSDLASGRTPEPDHILIPVTMPTRLPIHRQVQYRAY